MTAVQNGQYDATLQDVPAARFYRERFPGLELVGPPESHGYYVIYVRKNDGPLRDALDRGLARLIESGELRRIYEKYGIWTEAQNELATIEGPLPIVDGQRKRRAAGRSCGSIRARLFDAAFVTIALSVTSMPLAMALGLVDRAWQALWAASAPVGALRLRRADPRHAADAPAFRAVLSCSSCLPGSRASRGLAINYSAYEAEIYRAGLQAIPPGQMEAALALGMSRVMALRRVIIPQAVRIVIPPVTNDFIALFKDTSVCSVITLVELTKQYSILANSTGGAIEFALAVAALYMMMSVPLSWFSRWSERRLAAGGVKGGALA